MKRYFTLATLFLAFAACSDTPVGVDGMETEVVTAAASSGSAPLTQAEVDALTTISGGGFIREADYHISYGGSVVEDGSSTDWVVQFHTVSEAAVSGGTFEATGFEEFVFAVSDNPEECIAAARMRLTGTFNGEPGYKVIVRLGDAGKLFKDFDADDTIRFELLGSGGIIYDSSDFVAANPGGDFTANSSCVGSARTKVGGGNLRLH